MCGVAGYLSSSSVEGCTAEILKKMAVSLTHRGPDASGIWFDEDVGIGLAHTRLSILELSAAGAQPMQSVCKRFVLAFNGEIYNHLELRRKLELEELAPEWVGGADTETLLACIAVWGVERTLRSALGMFAIALWDSQDCVLTLARDRMGEKPLYWGWSGETVLFGSELKALKVHPVFSPEVDRRALALFLRCNYIPAPHSIYVGVEKLLPGHFVQIRGGQSRKVVTSKAYWSLSETIEAGLSNPFLGSDSEAVDLLESVIKESLSGQMEADVPLGAFLSGGVDSSAIVALMQSQSDKPIKTFSIGFDEPGYNEAEYAKAVADHLGTEHTELYVTAQDALDVIPMLSRTFCEPFADSSQIPTFLVSKMAKEYVTVALSGDGGDELFGGYNTYQLVPGIWRAIRWLPLAFRGFASGFFARLPLSDRLSKLIEVLPSKDQFEFYRFVTSHWKNVEQLVVKGGAQSMNHSDVLKFPRVNTFEEWMMATDTQQYMVDDVLVKVDRAAMACGLEVRVPMLDHRVVELAWRLPFRLKIRNKTGKWILREVLYRHVPPELIERPKKGFSIPLDRWLRGALKEWAEPLLSEQRLRREGFFYPDQIRKAWDEHQSGKRDHSSKLWGVLMFQSWLEREHNIE